MIRVAVGAEQDVIQTISVDIRRLGDKACPVNSKEGVGENSDETPRMLCSRVISTAHIKWHHLTNSLKSFAD